MHTGDVTMTLHRLCKKGKTLENLTWWLHSYLSKPPLRACCVPGSGVHSARFPEWPTDRPRSVLFGMNAGRERRQWPGWRVDKVGKSAETHQGPMHRPGEGGHLVRLKVRLWQKNLFQLGGMETKDRNFWKNYKVTFSFTSATTSSQGVLSVDTKKKKSVPKNKTS